MKRWPHRVSILLILVSLSVQSWTVGVANPVTWLLAGILVFTIVKYYQTRRAWQNLYQLANIPQTTADLTTLQQTLQHGKELSTDISHIIASIGVIGQESFPEVMKSVRNAELKETLLDAHNNIVELRKNEQAQSWITTGVAAISGLRSSDASLEEYALQVTSCVAKYVGANQGGLFILKEEEGEEYLDLMACYAYDKKKYVNKRINPGEGFIGQVYYEKEMILITDVPKDYIKITSGLGEALPRCICIVPLSFEGRFYGALEIACFHKLSPHQIEYLNETGDVVGYALHALENKIKTEHLLNESRQMAQEVKAQEEELRQNMEELTATQEQMKRKQVELDAVMDSLAVIALTMDGVIEDVNVMFLGSSGYEANDLLQKRYTELIPRTDSDRHQFELMWESLKSGRSFSGEFRLMNKRGGLVWMLGNFTPLLNNEGKPYKIMVITMFTTQEKEKILELQELVGAFRNNFPIAEINADMTLKTANELFLKEFGIKRMELRKLSMASLFYNGSIEQLQSNLASTTATNAGIQMNLAMRSTDGTLKQVNARMININQTSGPKRGLLIITNVTV